MGLCQKSAKDVEHPIDRVLLEAHSHCVVELVESCINLKQNHIVF
jgi:hypothetical protein